MYVYIVFTCIVTCDTLRHVQYDRILTKHKFKKYGHVREKKQNIDNIM